MKVYYNPSGEGLGGVHKVITEIKNRTKHFPTQNERIADIRHIHANGWASSIDILTSHGIYLEQDWADSDWRMKINDGMIKSMKASKVNTVVAKWKGDLLKSRYNIDLIYIPNGYDVEELNKFVKLGSYRTDFKKSKLPTFLIASGWNTSKNPSDIFKIARKFEGVAEFVCTISKYDVPYSDIPSNIRLIGPQDYNKLLYIMSKCDYLISPFPRENCPLVVLEAFGLRKPVLGCGINTGGNAELIQSGITGELYEESNLDDLCDKINQIISTDYPIKNFANLDPIYNWDRIVSIYDRLYENLYNVELPVSCYILAYNEHKYLPRAIASIPPGVEIVVADASHNHKDLVPDHCKYITVPNKNLSDNRTRAARACTRKYITSLDADDVACDGKFKMYKYLEEDPELAGVFGNASMGGTNYIDKFIGGLEDGKVYRVEDLLRSNIVPSGGILFRKDLFDKGLIDYGNGNLTYSEDYRLNITVSKIKIKYIDQTCYYYCTEKLGITRSANKTEVIRMLKDSMKEYGISEINNVVFGRISL